MGGKSPEVEEKHGKDNQRGAVGPPANLDLPGYGPQKIIPEGIWCPTDKRPCTPA